MISYEKYNKIDLYLKKVTRNVWECENDIRREKNLPTLELYQEGFSIEDCFNYEMGHTIFFFACNYSFLKVVGEKLLAARKHSPELFGTDDAQDILEALYEVCGRNCTIDEYVDYLQQYACCYLLYETEGVLSPNVLRIDLFRLLRPNKDNPKYLEFIGGIFHVLDHFSIDGKNLATGKDINDVSDIDEVLIYIAKAFLVCGGIKDKECKVTIQMKNGKPLNCVFFWDEKKEIHYITTLHRDKDNSNAAFTT